MIILRDEAEYTNALDEIERRWDEFDPDNPLHKIPALDPAFISFEDLILAVVAYEDAHIPI